MNIAECASRYVAGYNLAIIPLPPFSTAPNKPDWLNKSFRDAASAKRFFSLHPDHNIGCVLGRSNICSLDVDDVTAAKIVLSEFGIDLDALVTTHPTIQGNPARVRLQFAVPAGAQLSRHSLTWPRKDEPSKFLTVFELRAGDVQDVLPPSVHPDTRQPYRWRTPPKDGKFPELPEALLVIWNNWDIFKPQAQALCPWAPKALPTAIEKPRHTGHSVIDAWNAAHPLRGVLERYGYVARGRRYLSPHSATKLPGVSLFDDGARCYIHHASDPLCSAESGHPVNSFDLYRHYEHGGNIKAAVRAAAELLGIKREREPRTNSSTTSQTGADTGISDGVELIEAQSVKPEAIGWLWPDWLARGKLHVLAGAPGTGKTTIALDIAACVSAGRAFASGHVPEHGNVIIWSGEDAPADTLVPRLLAMGADLARIKFVGEVTEAGQRFPFDPARDVDKLSSAAAKVDGVVVLIVDPLVSAVSGDSHKNAEVRRGLAPLVNLAAHLGAALIGITHYSKGTAGRDPLERVTGSVAFGALARLVLGTVRQEQKEGEPRTMTLARAKSNIGPDGGGFTYSIEQIEVPRHAGMTAARIAWGSAVEGTARELLTEIETNSPECEARDAVDWLRDSLANGPMTRKEVQVNANDAGFAWRTVQRAMRPAGVESHRAGFGMPAMWSIRANSTQSRQLRPSQEDGANGATEGGETLPATLQPSVTCGSCAHFKRDSINPANGMGACRTGCDPLRPWPHVSRACQKWSQANVE